MPAAHLTLREEDVVRLTLEFLHSRDLHISQLSLERETGVINGQYSDDVLFLRQLILDGQWDDVLEFIQPLEALPDFDMRKFTYSILRHKYVELLCIKSEANFIAAGTNGSVDNAVEEVVKVLSDLEKVAPSKEEYSSLCLLLTLPRLTDHLQYKDWNPSNARVQCFREVHPLVEKFLPGDRKSTDPAHPVTSAKNDRLIQLIIKGILYESCVNYCQAKATGSKESEQVCFTTLETRFRVDLCQSFLHFSTGGDEFLETVGRLGRFQRFRLEPALLVAKYTTGDVRRAFRAAHVERGRGTIGEALVGDLLDRTHADHPHKAQDFPAQRDAVHKATIRRRHDVSQFSPGFGSWPRTKESRP